MAPAATRSAGFPAASASATIGLLEDLQNANLYRTTDSAHFRLFLRPESLKWWNRVDSFWKGNPRALQEDRDGDPAAG